jgi:hypothetical protein
MYRDIKVAHMFYNRNGQVPGAKYVIKNKRIAIKIILWYTNKFTKVSFVVTTKVLINL